MARLLLAFVFVVIGCASVPAVPKDVPGPDQCFESSFNPYRIVTEKWEVLENHGAVYVLKNPNPGYPKIVLIQVNQFGHVLSYLYLDGKDLVAYAVDGKCYRKVQLDPDTSEKLKLYILNLCKEKHCAL